MAQNHDNRRTAAIRRLQGAVEVALSAAATERLELLAEQAEASVAARDDGSWQGRDAARLDSFADVKRMDSLANVGLVLQLALTPRARRAA